MVGFLIGLAPARQAARGELAGRLRAGKQSQGEADLRLRRGLVATELGLASVLLTGAVLLVNTIGHLRRVDPGFKVEHVVSFRTQLPSAAYPTGEAVGRFYNDLIDRISAVPGVESAAAAMMLPLSSNAFGGTFTSAIPTEAGEESDRRGQVRVVTANYFKVMGIPIRQGRGFEAGDRRGAPPVLVASEGFSKRFWPTTGAVGKVVRFGVRPGPEQPEGTIIGLVGDVRSAGLHRDPVRTVYAVMPQVTSSEMSFVVKTAQPPGTLIPAVRGLLEARDRDIVLDDVATLDDLVGQSLGRPRFITELLALFAGLAVLLATVGIYGVVSYSVAQRTREIGVRMALGADAGRVTRTVLLEEIRWAVGGLAVGSIAAVAVAPLLASVVYGLDTRAPWYQALAAFGLLGVAVVACLVPALRAARVSPMTAIRAE